MKTFVLMVYYNATHSFVQEQKIVLNLQNGQR